MDPLMYWLVVIAIGGVAGWLAANFMKSSLSMLANIVLGIVGSIVANFLFGLLGISLGGGWIGLLISGFIGACILIWLARTLRKA